MDRFGNAEKVIYCDPENNLNTIEASVFILACSGAGTRLLLNSSRNGDKTGICNSSGLVGKNLMLHPLGYVEGLFDEYLETSFSGLRDVVLLVMSFTHQDLRIILKEDI